MKSFAAIAAVVVSLVSVSPSFAEPIRLSVAEAIRLAAERNLDVRAELYTPAQFEAEINRNRGIYDPALNLELNYTDSIAPFPGIAGIVSSRGQSLQLNSSLSQFFPTGTIATLGFDNSYNNSDSTANPRDFWQSNLGITLSQPLLKNFGRENSELQINISRFSKTASIENFSTLLMNTVARVRNEYFRLYSLREQLEVRKVSLELARKILADTRARVTAGVLPAMEILNAEFGVTSRERELIETEKAVSDEVDTLRLLLQIKGDDELLTINLPRREPLQIDPEQAIKLALNRPDIRAQKRNLDIVELQTRVLNNNIKPDLSVIASGFLSGFDNRYPRNLDRLGSFDYPGWSIGVNFSYPLGNNVARNDYRRSHLKSDQTRLQIRSLEETAINSVKAAIRGVNTNYKQIDVADRGRAYAEERLKAFIRRNEVGLATTRDVLDVENELATAKNNQIIALVNYDNAITQLLLATGEILEKEGIRVVEEDADKLYSSIR